MPETMTTFVAGVTFDGRQELLAGLHDAVEGGAVLGAELRREPDNPYDKNAIQVIVNGLPVGYVPREVARDLASRIDAGDQVTVIFTEVYRRKHSDGETMFGAKIRLSIIGKEAV